jgi:hypothetical protein
MSERRRYMIRMAMILTTPLWGTAAHAGDGEIMESGKAAIGAKLIHPDTARFSDVHLIQKAGRTFVCGHVVAISRTGTDDRSRPFVFIVGEKNARHSAIIYGGGSITNDRSGNWDQPAAFLDLCGH